ncbi:photosystem I chlorophyll a apoprotein A2 [Tanacetum coccineum]
MDPWIHHSLDPSFSFAGSVSMKDLLDAHIHLGGQLGCGHKSLYDTINNSLHFQLGLALASLGVITSLVVERITKKRTKNKAKTTKLDSEWKRL